MKKFLLTTCSVVLVLCLTLCFVACGEPTREQLLNKYADAIEQEMRGSFDFFWNEAQTEEPAGYGLIADRAGITKNSAASIASVGFGLAAYVVGAEKGYVTAAEAEERSVGTLRTLLRLQQEGEGTSTRSGFFAHFLNMRSGYPAPGTEISSIDTAIALCGALAAGEYFGGEAETLANQIYSNVNWQAMRMTRGGKQYIAMTFSGNTPTGPWDYYAEQLMIYVLGAGSPNAEYRLDDREYYDFTRQQGRYGNHNFIYSWFGSIFTYQFSHAFIDFRGIVDKNGTNWWDNSVEASLAAYEYCRDNSAQFKTFRKGGWGLTACDGVDGYCGYIGAEPRGWSAANAPDNESIPYKLNRATIAPCGALGSVVFTPQQSLKALQYYQTVKYLNGDYGLYDSYNLDKDFYCMDYIGIDKGITLVMLYNYECDGIWNLLNNNQYLQNGLNVLGFSKAQ